MPPAPNGPDLPADLDTTTTLALGQALYAFLAGLNPESHTDTILWEDAGVLITAGMIEIDPETLATVGALIEQHRTA